MPLSELISSGFDCIGEWRRMWNGEVLPYLRSQAIVAGPGIRAERLPAGTVVSAAPAPGARSAAAPGDYDSYFKLTCTTNGGGCVVKIADGATGGDSVAVVNGMTAYRVAPYAETVSANRLFYLKYTPPVYDAQGALSSAAALEIGSTDAQYLTAYRNGCFYIQLGRALFSGGAPRIVQDFTAGVADVRWYMTCGE